MRYGLAPSVFERQIEEESGFNPRALSSKGAQGIAQIMPETARDWGVNPWDPIASLDVAARAMASYYRTYRRQGRSPRDAYALALAAYNAGPHRVAQYGCVPPYAETRAYVRRILGS